MKAIGGMRLTEKRAVIAAISNMGCESFFDEVCDPEAARSLMISGLMENDMLLYEWDPRYEGMIEKKAIDTFEAEYQVWVEKLGRYAGGPLPEYWRNVDQVLVGMGELPHVLRSV